MYCTDSDAIPIGRINLNTISGDIDIKNGTVSTNLAESRRMITE